MTDAPYKRILLKLSGEALLGSKSYGIDYDVVDRIAQDIKNVHDQGIQIAVVVGGGNIFRGAPASKQGMDRSTADSMGMLATVMNALSMQSALEQHGVETRVLSAVSMTAVCEPYIRRKAVRHLEKGRIVFLAGGTGNPFFTTDTAAALRASELDCDALFKGTQVDGVYTSDPKKDPAAIRHETISYRDVLVQDLRVMDAAAISLCRENMIPVVVFSIHNPHALAQVLLGQGAHTTIKN